MKKMKAKIKVIRDNFTDKSTQGKLYLNDEYVCETLEDKCRDYNHDGDLDDAGETKIYGETAIPLGIYKITIAPSPHFKFNTPRLQGVKNYSGVLIHPGNWVTDTLGCILVGFQRGKDCIKVGTSKKAFDLLMDKLKQFSEYEIEIIDKIESDDSTLGPTK